MKAKIKKKDDCPDYSLFPGYPVQYYCAIINGFDSLFVMLLLFRASNAILCRSLFVPDEHWQCLEIAYKMVFDRGYLSWEWQKGIRGYTHPLIFAILYKILAVFQLDTPTIMAVSPRLLQSVLAATSDLYVYILARTLFDSTTAKYALLSHILSWYTFYSCTRTLSNSIEASLTPLILYYWVMAAKRNTEGPIEISNTFLYLSLSAVSVIIRPTGAIMWAPLFLYHLLSTTRTFRIKLLCIAFIVGAIAILWSLLIDRCFYGQWVLTPLNFFKFNVLDGSSALFGVHPWHWYLSQGLPTILFTSIPFFLHGAWEVSICRSGRHSRLPLYLGVWLVVAHSFLKHKEFRFVQPFLPLSAVYIGLSLNKICRLVSALQLSSVNQWWQRPLLKMVLVGLLLINIPMSAYFCLIHQRGGYAVMDHLRNEHIQDMTDSSTILFLMPCHSTPQYSLLHTNATLSFLHCQYEWNYNDRPFIDEYFYQDPILWVRNNILNSPAHPDYIVLYDVLYEEIKLLLHDYYQMTNKMFHTHFRDNDRVGSYIIILKKHSQSSIANGLL